MAMLVVEMRDLTAGMEKEGAWHICWVHDDSSDVGKRGSYASLKSLKSSL